MTATTPPSRTTCALTAPGAQPRRLFTVTAAGNLGLRDLALTFGDAGGAAAPDNQGGGIFNSGSLSLVRTVLGVNTAVTGEGGAIFNTGTLTITGSLISGNSALNGGGIFNTAPGSTLVTGSIFSSNVSTGAGSGSALQNAGGSVTIRKSTLHTNLAPPATGAMVVNGRNAALTPGQMSLVNATIVFGGTNGVLTTGLGSALSVINSTLLPTSPGTSAAIADAQAALSLSNSILSAPASDCLESSSGTITAQGFNVASDGTCAAAVGSNAHFIGFGGTADPMLGGAMAFANADNVPQFVLPLMAGSPALDKADPAICASAPVSNLDQLARTRFQDGDGDGTLICDIGAFEMPGADGDGDGVSDALEAAVPTRDASGNIIAGLFGDGNADTLADSGQNTVASLVAANNASFITVQSVTGGALTGVVLSADMPTGTPAGFSFPFGLLRFTTAATPANVVITYPGTVNAYFKFNDDPNTAGQTPLGYTRADGAVNSIAGITSAASGARVTLNLTNGTFGDVDNAGTITDPGAAAGTSTVNTGPPVPGAPTVVVIEEDDDGCSISGRPGSNYELLLLALLAACGIWYTRRRSLV